MIEMLFDDRTRSRIFVLGGSDADLDKIKNDVAADAYEEWLASSVTRSPYPTAS